MAKRILIKPLISEKTESLSDKLNQYTFVVEKNVNKIEIKEAVAKFYNVEVLSVNTVVMPARAKSRMTRSGSRPGRVSGYKKAIVTVAEGEYIDFYGDV